MTKTTTMRLAFLLALLLSAATTTVIGSSTGTYMNFHFPTSLNRKGDGWDHVVGHFGRSNMALASHVGFEGYGSVSAQVYVAPTPDLCHHVDTTTANSTTKYNVPFVLFVWRNSDECTFVSQTRRAQHLGASAVIIADNICIESDKDNCQNPDGNDNVQKQAPILADDGSGGDVTIPALYVRKQDGMKIHDVLAPKNNSTNNQHRPVMVTLRWEPPTANSTDTNSKKSKDKTPNNKKVYYGMTLDLMDHHTAEFTSNIRHVALAFGKDATFYPSYLMYDGYKIGCKDHPEDCKLTCTNSGRYCYPHIMGAQVVTEVLNRICIWEHYGDQSTYNNKTNVPGTNNGLERGEAFWNYVDYFDQNCDAFTIIEGNEKKQKEQQEKREKCITKAYKKAKIRKDTIDLCMKDSGTKEGTNSKLQDHLDSLERYGVTVAPSIWVQNLTVPNYWRPPTPTGLMQALCGSFNLAADSRNIPSACKRCMKKLNDDDILRCTQTYYDDHYKHPHRHIWRTLILFAFICFGGAVAYVVYRRQQDGMDLSADNLYNPLRNVNDRLQNMRTAYMPLGGGSGGGGGGGDDSTMGTTNGGVSAAALLPGSGSSIIGLNNEENNEINGVVQEEQGTSNPFQ